VTVCIAIAYRKIPPDDQLILVTDNRVAFGDFSGEHLSIKSSALWHGWTVMFAGNDVEHAEPILRAAKKSMQSLAKKSGRVIQPEEAVAIVDAAYSKQLQKQIENKILRKHGFNIETFQRIGRLRCTPEVYAKTCEKIDKEKLSLRFLVCGHDERRGTHIWVVDGENAPASYNSIGFWAIGSGGPAALNRIALYLSRYQEFKSLEDVIYVAVTAKFAAEGASDVGRSTFRVINRHWAHDVDSIPIDDMAVDAIRASWDAHGIPPVPDIARKALKEHLKKAERWTSKEIQQMETAKAKQLGARKLKPER
jgi:hypothetical protein